MIQSKWPSWRTILFYVFISILYVFRATSCSSSGESILSTQPLVFVTLCRWPFLVHETSGVPQGNVLGPLIYLLHTADLPAAADTETATFADDTSVLTTHVDPTIATHRLQTALHDIQQWLRKWRMEVNETKSIQVTFTLKRSVCPSVQLNNKHLAQPDDVKYLGIHLHRKLTWRKHINTKRKQLDLKLRKLYWITSRKSQLSQETNC